MKKVMYSGQSLFEVVIAIAVITMVLVGVVVMATNSVRNSNFSKNETTAGRYAQEAIEWIRFERDSDIETFTTRNGSYCFDTLSWANTGVCSASEYIEDTIFLRTVNLSSATQDLKTIYEATVAVSWVDSQGTHEVRSTTSFNDPREK